VLGVSGFTWMSSRLNSSPGCSAFSSILVICESSRSETERGARRIVFQSDASPDSLSSSITARLLARSLVPSTLDHVATMVDAPSREGAESREPDAANDSVTGSSDSMVLSARQWMRGAFLEGQVLGVNSGLFEKKRSPILASGL
jgi:hypothetical protein